MELLLLIFKIILIAFLIVIGVLFFLLGLVLFVPIRYEVSGNIGDSWEIKLQGRIAYLLSIVKVLFSYEKEQFDVNFFFFGFKKKKAKEDDFSQAESKEASKEACEEVEETLDSETVSEELLKENDELERLDSDIEIKTEKVYSNEQKESDSVSKTQKVSSAKKKPQTKKKTQKTSEPKKRDFDFWKNELTDEHNKSVVRKVLIEIGYLLRHFRFRKMETDIIFSTGDPAVTGQVLGVLCMLPLFYQYQFYIVPDFETESFYIK
ncbi:MAG: DUF2953 domain-containing protein, partial [Lachnospiraceae bacterium]|nr:DUF2953 domain-containing protein [Lachnospiraceae bacterium]